MARCNGSSKPYGLTAGPSKNRRARSCSSRNPSMGKFRSARKKGKAWICSRYGAVPGTGNGQKLGLPAPAQRGDPEREAWPVHQGQAGRPGTIPGKTPLPAFGGVTSPGPSQWGPEESARLPELHECIRPRARCTGYIRNYVSFMSTLYHH